MTAKGLNTKMSKAEMIVAGLAIALLVTGFATGGLAKPAQANAHAPWQNAHPISVQAQDRS